MWVSGSAAIGQSVSQSQGAEVDATKGICPALNGTPEKHPKLACMDQTATPEDKIQTTPKNQQQKPAGCLLQGCISTICLAVHVPDLSTPSHLSQQVL
jgi:hypothetical protein